MKFKLFIYYCALCGGWGGFLAWAFAALFSGIDSALLKQTLIGSVLGLFLSVAISGVDAQLNNSFIVVVGWVKEPFQRSGATVYRWYYKILLQPGFWREGLPRVLLAGAIGLFGAMFVGLIGRMMQEGMTLYQAETQRLIAEALV